MKSIKILICGGRYFEEYNFFETYLDSFLEKHDFDYSDIEIVSGGCKGTDKLAERFAQEHGCATKVFLADWKQYGRAAGPIRNKQMVDYINQFEQKFVIAFTSTDSKGSLGTIKLANSYNIPVFQIDYEVADFTSNLYEGVSYNPDTEEFDFNWFKDNPEDLIYLTQTSISLSKFKNKIYYFGYKFNQKTNKKHRDLFLQFIKKETGSDSQVNELVNTCISKFYASSKIKHFDYLLKLPSRSNLNTLITKAIYRVDNPKEIELVKKPIEELEIDWDAIKEKTKNKPDFDFDDFYTRMSAHIKNVKKAPYFSSQKVRNILKPYIKPMIIFGKDSIENSKNTEVLIIDDILTSGTSLNMVLQQLESIDFKGTITILTLIKNR